MALDSTCAYMEEGSYSSLHHSIQNFGWLDDTVVEPKHYVDVKGERDTSRPLSKTNY